MHNMLTTLSLIALIGAAVLSFMNKENLAAAKVDQTEMKTEKQETEAELAESTSTLEELDANLVTATSELKTHADEAEALTTQIQAKEEELETLESDLTNAQETLSGMKEQFSTVGDLEAAKSQLEELRKEVASLKSKANSLTNEVTSATNTSQRLQDEIDKITELNKKQDEGIVPEDFSAAISQVYTDWGFVVLGAGNNQRAAEGATLSVKRGGAEIAQLKITDLLQNRAVADVVRGSLADGVTLRAGDRAYAQAK
jgi:chromosome segregation ATPase